MDVILWAWGSVDDELKEAAQGLSRSEAASTVQIFAADGSENLATLAAGQLMADVVIIAAQGAPGVIGPLNSNASHPIGDVFARDSISAGLVILLLDSQQDLSSWRDAAPGAVIAACLEIARALDLATLAEGFVSSWARNQMYPVDDWIMLWPDAATGGDGTPR